MTSAASSPLWPESSGLSLDTSFVSNRLPVTCYRTLHWKLAFRRAARAGIALVLALLAVLLFGRIPGKRNFSLSLSATELASLITPEPREFPVRLEREPLRLNWSARILHRLEEAERRELNPHFRDDIRIAWVTTLFALRSEPQPFVRATYACLGVHPDQVWPRIVAFRKWMLGAEYEAWVPETSSPKKPAQSVTAAGEEKIA
jgi:hypothetical protein